MKKLIILVMFMFGCVSFGARENYVRKELENQYLSSVAITNYQGRAFGSGVVIYHKKNHSIMVLTATHVVVGMLHHRMAPYVLFPFEKYPKKINIEKVSFKKDLTLLSCGIAEQDGSYVKIARYSPNIGDDVWVIGAILGNPGTITKGIISNMEYDGEKTLYRADSVAFFGNSGGGMFDKNGDLVGIAHAVQQLNGLFAKSVVPGGFYFVAHNEIKTFLSKKQMTN